MIKKLESNSSMASNDGVVYCLYSTIYGLCDGNLADIINALDLYGDMDGIYEDSEYGVIELLKADFSESEIRKAIKSNRSY